jgi:general secretion pathway protein J
MTRIKHRARALSDSSGFTLIEALVSTALMVAILGVLVLITAQWLPNWDRGFARVQQTELTAGGLERIVADLSAAEFIPPTGDAKGPLFDWASLSVTFVRSALGPNTRPGLEFVRIAETADERGFAMVRLRAPFVPIAVQTLDQVGFSDPVVLVRAPYRVSFAYAGTDRIWHDSWRGAAELPSAVRLTLRDAATAQALAISTVAIVHVNTPAECVRARDPKTCDAPKTGAAQVTQ